MFQSSFIIAAKPVCKMLQDALLVSGFIMRIPSYDVIASLHTFLKCSGKLKQLNVIEPQLFTHCIMKKLWRPL